MTPATTGAGRRPLITTRITTDVTTPRPRRRWSTPTRVRRTPAWYFSPVLSSWMRVTVTHCGADPYGVPRVRVVADDYPGYAPFELPAACLHIGRSAPRHGTVPAAPLDTRTLPLVGQGAQGRAPDAAHGSRDATPRQGCGTPVAGR